jgi:hypothetical protein
LACNGIVDGAPKISFVSGNGSLQAVWRVRERYWVRELDIAPERDDSVAVPIYRRAFVWLKGRSIMMRIVLAVAALLVLPYVLIFLYLVPFIHPVSTLMLRDLALFRGYDRQWVSIDDIAPVLVQSVMMSEDGQYCFHGGVDWGEMRMLVTDTLGGKSTRGGSTIPMQTAKNLFLWNSRSFVRKAMELLRRAIISRCRRPSSPAVRRHCSPSHCPIRSTGMPASPAAVCAGLPRSSSGGRAARANTSDAFMIDISRCRW